MRIFVNALITILICAISFSAQAITPAKEKDIKTLLVLMGNTSMAEEMANSMVTISIAQEKKRYPNLPKKVEHALSQAIYDVIMKYAPELDELTVPLYDKYYTHKEILDLITFFNTPTGKKYASVCYPMMQEINPIVQQWAEKIAPIAAKRVEQELEKYGYK